MVRRFITSMAFVWATMAFAQQSHQASNVGVFINDSVYFIEPQTTQTEVKAGWKIVDYQTRNKTTRYLWGTRSKQPIDNTRPCFYINPGTTQLTDFAIIRLTPKRDCRKLPKAQLRDCKNKPFDLYTVKAELMPDDNYKVTINEPLLPGEYIITQMTQKSVDDMGNIIVYPFTIESTNERSHWNKAY